ncbi:F-BAR and double SH3 domains protein 1 isoform X2 [Hemicordylus capensis]|uniref:F-BAR and double SH3 domains protein 1 isoform X2 n=1 Tax=Hemicordylus capensis TaxID=884348 RepID=UPI002302E14D|nr:F-BAR and double SH3 domains protein 1 isoform X2 [Hemicordylus capensis]
MQPPPRKVKLTQEVKVRFIEQLSSLQNKHQRELELLEDIRSYSKQRSAIEREYGQALQRLASPFLKRDWQRGQSDINDSRSIFLVWKRVIEGTICSGQSRIAASDNYRSASTDAAKMVRVSKEHLLKKGMERLLNTQTELLETVKEVSKTKKQYVHLQRANEVVREKAADIDARLRKSDHGIFHTKASLQKLSAKFLTQLAENSQQLVVARNEYLLTLAAANAHLEHYYHVELPTAMKILDGDLYERLQDQLTLISKTDLETCQGMQELFQGILDASAQVCREQNLILFLQANPVFSAMVMQPFHPAGADQISLLDVGGSNIGESELKKEARRWATRAARDYKIQTVSTQLLQRMETRRQQIPEAEMASMEKRMEEVRENIRKAEISKVKSEARLALLRQAGLDVDTWLASAMGQVLDEMEQERRLSEARRSERGSTPMAEEFDLADFEDYDDSTELFEDTRPSPNMARVYPSSCRVFFPYQACQSDELSIVQGEELEVIEDGDMEEWVKARNRAGQVGYVPEKYLLFLDSISRECTAPDGNSQEGSSDMALERELTNIMSMDLMLEPGARLVRALYDYEGQSAEELSFPEGAIIRVLTREEGAIDDGFWKGDFNGRVGVFPSLVVQEITGTQERTEQELLSPSPPAFSPPILVHSAASPEVLLGGGWQGSGHGSTDLNVPRFRPVRVPPPPPSTAPKADSLSGHD